jgi:hypothetical protein
MLHMRGAPGVASRTRLGGRLVRTSEVVDGAISARLKEHAWKAIPAANANPHRSAATRFASRISCNNDVPCSVLVNDAV